jgi:hypothetical protein
MFMQSDKSVLDIDQDDDDKDVQKEWLPKWESLPSLMNMKRDYVDAKPFKDLHVNKINNWLDNYHVRGAAQPKTPKGFSSVQPKLIRKQAEWRYAPLSEPFLSTPDLFIASPVSWEDKEGAMQHQLILNNQFSTVIDRVEFIDEYVRTAVDEGTVIVRTGWEYEEANTTEKVDQYEFIDPTSQEEHQLTLENLELARDGMMHHKPEWESALQHSLLAQRPLMPRYVRSIFETKTRVIVNQPSVEVINTANLTIDPTCNGNIDKAQFLVYAFETSLSDLKKSGNYFNLENIIIAPGTHRNTDPDFTADGDSAFNFADKDRSKLVAYEYWGYHDIHQDGTMHSFVATWVKDVLIRLETNPFPDKKFPFIKVKYLPVRRSAYGEPDGALIEDNQKIVGAVTRGIVDIIGRSANGQMGTMKGALDVVNRRRFDAGLDYEFNGNTRPEQAFYMHKYPEIPQSAPLMLQHQNSEAESFTGVKAFSAGLTGDALGRTSAAGVRGVLDAASKREVAILRRLAKGIIEIGKKIIAMNTEFLSEKEIIRVTNEDFVEIQKDKLVGKYDLKLNISTAEEDVTKAQELAFMLQTVGNTAGPEMTQIILADIARLRKMPDLAKKIETYKPQPDPFEQMLKELEIEKMRADIMERQAVAQERMAQAQLNMAKAGTEGVKQGNIQSATDLTNLDLIEQESGVKQERELQKSSAQAEANMKLKLFEKQVDEVFSAPKENPTGE